MSSATRALVCCLEVSAEGRLLCVCVCVRVCVVGEG